MKKILLVEDDPFLSKVLGNKLTQENFDVVLAKDGEEAIEKIKKEVPDLILLDLILPKKDGFQVLEEIKKEEKTKNIPVIILSNLGQESDIERGKELGAIDYLVKVRWSLQDVIEKIKRYV